MSKLDFIKTEIKNGYKGFLKNEIMYDNYNSVSTSYYPVFFHEYKYGIGVSVYYISLIKEITIKVSSLIFVFIITMILIIFYFTILIDNEKKIASNLNESERSINKIINTVPFGIVLYDSNMVVKSNEYAKNEIGIIEGKTPNEMISKFLEIKNNESPCFTLYIL
jgi:c-di-AMP phosphodiesterase-like protein